MNNKIVLVVGVIVIALIIGATSYLSGRPAEKKTHNMTTTTWEHIIATSSTDTEEPTDVFGTQPFFSGDTSGDTAENDHMQQASSSGDTVVSQPTITTTPYSVYIGFATKAGTSTADMDTEVSEAVIGYEWEALIGSPHFSTVNLPVWNPAVPQQQYVVHVWKDGAYTQLGRYPAGEEVEFPRDGLNGAQKFKVTGIDPTLGICPGDRSFVWEVRFVFNAEFGLVRTPITQSLPGDETCRMR